MQSNLIIHDSNVYSIISGFTPHEKNIIVNFCRRNLGMLSLVPAKFPGGKPTKEINHVFASFNHDKTELRLARPIVEDLLEYLKWTIGNFTYKRVPLLADTPTPALIKWKDNNALSPNSSEQQDYLDFLIAEENDLVVINARTGLGKTVIAIMGFIKLGYRVIITIMPKHVPIWIQAFTKCLELTPLDILNVSDHDFNVVYEALKEGRVNPSIIFFNLTRIDIYRKRMKEHPESLPHLDDFFKVLGGGVRIIDEAHESIYSVYMSLMFGRPNKVVGLSATLRADDEFINKMYRYIFPPRAYLKETSYKKYITSISFYHRINLNAYRIRTLGAGGYSHVAYEKSILKIVRCFENYYKVLKKAFELCYLEDRLPEQKALFFFSTVEMCERVAKRLKRDYPNEDIFVFTGKISKIKGMGLSYNDHRIIITTPQSCGTGKDIEKLFVVISGVSVSSMQRIDQMTGRLREVIKWWPGLSPKYVSIIARDISKQMEYDNKKKIVINKKTIKFQGLESGIFV